MKEVTVFTYHRHGGITYHSLIISMTKCHYLILCLHYVLQYLLGHVEAKVRCDDITHAIYVDGQNVGNTNNSDAIWASNLADGALLIAVDCENIGAWGGLIASFGNGLTTDNTWRCSSNPGSGWYKEDFDDNDWDRAYIIQSNPTVTDVQRWVKDNEFSESAEWIWKDQNYLTLAHSYCRGRLRK